MSRVVILVGILGAGDLNECTENNTAKGRVAQRAKAGAEPAKSVGGRH